MARDRQRAKQRQAERRAQRQAERRAARLGERRDAQRDGDSVARREAAPLDEPTPADLTEIKASAPDEDLGRSDSFVAAQEPPEVDELDEFVDEELAFDAEQAEPEDEAVAEQALREQPKAEQPQRGRVLTFLAACWAELQRVQWPKRRALTQLTGIVLFFVLIAGGYLGLLDAIFSRVVQAII
jgi:preprotein translocase SecE subunit